MISIFGNILVLPVVGLLIWLWFGTNYRVENEYIEIKHGPFREKLPIQDINHISKKKSVLTTPALAIDRVLLKYGTYGEIMVSPKNEKEFIDLLLNKNPRITLEKPLKEF